MGTLYRYLLAGLLLQLTVAGTHGADRVTVENERVAVTLTAEAHGAVASLRDVARQRELMAESESAQLFTLELSEQGAPDAKRFYVSSREAKEVVLTAEGDGPGSSARVEFRRKYGFAAVRTTPIMNGCRWIEASESLPCLPCHIPTIRAAHNAFRQP